ncbi:MAG: hypothetical protein HY548_07065 [Elusimicrobia bacterium]|nr:hypothetical protein [Elusimicrobiota bacterium]
MTEMEIRKLIDETIVQIATKLEALFVEHDVEEQVIWQVMKQLDLAHSRAVARLMPPSSPQGKGGETRDERAVHPALDALNLKIEMERRGG